MADLSALHDIALFIELGRTLNFSRASERLGISTATLSRRIAATEARFKIRLFNRTTRRVELTEAGRRYFERCEHLADEARQAQESLHATAQRPIGHLRVSMPVDLGVHYIGPLVPEFARQYPGISLELDLSSHYRDLIGAPIDVAIRLGAFKGDNLVARRIGWIERRLFASPAYLDIRGRPAWPQDLPGHECLFAAAGQKSMRWQLEQGDRKVTIEVQGRFNVNNQGLMHVLCERHLGIGALAPSMAREALDAGRLVPVLSDWRLERMPVHAVTASRQQPATVKALVEFLASRLDTR